MSLPTAADPADVAWDLEPLVDGDGAAGRRPAARRGRRARRRVRRRATPAGSPSSTARASPPRWTSSRRSPSSSGRAGTYAALRFAADTDDPANGALLAARAGARRRRSRRQLLFFDLEWAALDDERAEELLAADGLDLVPPPPAHRPPLPPAPALRARGEGPDREGGDRPRRVVAPVQRADERDPRRAARRRSEPRRRSTSRWPPVVSPDREVRRSDRRGGDRGAAARPAHARLHLQHARCRTRPSTTACAATRPGSRSRNLANEASDESVQALVAAVKGALRPARSAGTG